MLTVVTTGSDNGSDNNLVPSIPAFPRRRAEFADLREVLTLLKLLLTDAASNKCSAMSINTVCEVLARDADPLTAAIGQLKGIDEAPFLHTRCRIVHKYYAQIGGESRLLTADKVFHRLTYSFPQTFFKQWKTPTTLFYSRLSVSLCLLTDYCEEFSSS